MLFRILFIYINKYEIRSVGFINYFVIQEFFGLLFLLFSYYNIIFLFLIFKIGVSPFYFWVLNIFNNLSNWQFI